MLHIPLWMPLRLESPLHLQDGRRHCRHVPQIFWLGPCALICCPGTCRPGRQNAAEAACRAGAPALCG